MPHIKRAFHVAVAAIAAVALIAAAACGSGSSSSASSASSTATPTAGRGRGLRFRNGTPNPAIETSIAEGTPPPFGNRTPPPAVQTAIAEGTPRSALRGGFGGRELATVAFIIGITPQQLLSELQAPGASIQSVAAAHGKDRATIRQALIDANRLRLATEVSSGTITQAMADQQQSQFVANVDSLIDRVGTARQ
ncbi:MAG: hypothetical protein KGK07_11350 [Chloroflexota bacterium]|nr:hypothetical protein [Chloroflexota bacterium]